MIYKKLRFAKYYTALYRHKTKKAPDKPTPLTKYKRKDLI